MSTQNVEILLYRLMRDTPPPRGTGRVRWDCPDGVTYELDPEKAVAGQWLRVDDANGLPVMALLKGDPNSPYWWLRDGRLAVSLHPLKLPLPATLLHDEDDQGRMNYFSTDGGNTRSAIGPLAEPRVRRPAFILQTQGEKGCPIITDQGFRVMIVRPTDDIRHP